MHTGVIISLALYFLLMLGIGVYAWRKSTGDSEGYLLAGRDLSPKVTALSAGAADMSGWLLLGLPGALYASGLVEAWIAIGLFAGALTNWIVVAPRLRRQTEALGDALTIPEFLGNRFPDKAAALRLTSALIVVVFFTVYTGAGMVAGGKLFETAFAGSVGGDYMTGIWVTAGVVLVYTMIGGFLAVSLTDFVQGVIMFAALVIMPLVIVFGSADLPPVGQEGFLSLTNGLTAVGWLSAVTWGLGYFGQPHIIVRFMAIRSVDEMPAARTIAMAWMGACLVGAIGVGLAGRAYIEGSGIALEDPETVFILLANLLFHPLVTGFLYAALLAAVMSTISSQLLVSSSSLTEDFYRLVLRKSAGEKEAVMVGRASVLLVALMGIAIAADPESQVLSLVAHAWAGFGAAFGPMIVLALTWQRMTGAGAVAGLVTGAAVVIGWIALGWDQAFLGGPGVYEILPGFAASWLAIVVVSRATWRQPIAAAPPPTVH